MNLLKTLLHGIISPLKKKPVRILLLGGGIYFLGVFMGWWPNLLADVFSNLKE